MLSRCVTGPSPGSSGGSVIGGRSLSESSELVDVPEEPDERRRLAALRACRVAAEQGRQQAASARRTGPGGRPPLVDVSGDVLLDGLRPVVPSGVVPSGPAAPPSVERLSALADARLGGRQRSQVVDGRRCRCPCSPVRARSASVRLSTRSSSPFDCSASAVLAAGHDDFISAMRSDWDGRPRPQVGELGATTAAVRGQDHPAAVAGRGVEVLHRRRDRGRVRGAPALQHALDLVHPGPGDLQLLGRLGLVAEREQPAGRLGRPLDAVQGVPGQRVLAGRRGRHRRAPPARRRRSPGSRNDGARSACDARTGVPAACSGRGPRWRPRRGGPGGPTAGRAARGAACGSARRSSRLRRSCARPRRGRPTRPACPARRPGPAVRRGGWPVRPCRRSAVHPAARSARRGRARGPDAGWHPARCSERLKPSSAIASNRRRRIRAAV